MDEVDFLKEELKQLNILYQKEQKKTQACRNRFNNLRKQVDMIRNQLEMVINDLDKIQEKLK
jgi:septation ring formation regulator EzrA